MKTIFSNKRITSSNIQSYIAEIMYPEVFVDTTVKDKVIAEVPALLQKDYGEKNDCTLTSLTALLMLLKKLQYSAKEIYKIVEFFARQYGYTGTKGTNPFTIKHIFDCSLSALALFKETKVKFLKNIGYNFSLIKKNIDAGTPIILSMYSDGRNYYSNHSVLIIGYREYQLSNINSKKIKRFLIVQDNWTTEKSFIDYDKLSIISSINY